MKSICMLFQQKFKRLPAKPSETLKCGFCSSSFIRCENGAGTLEWNRGAANVPLDSRAVKLNKVLLYINAKQ